MTGELERRSYVVAGVGEIVDLDKPDEVAAALEAVRRLKGQLDEARIVLEDVLRYESERAGSRTLRFGELTATVTGGTRTEYDVLELGERLRALDIPEDRLAELITETVTYKVDQRVARSVAASNPRYAEAIEAARRVVPASVRVQVKRGGTR